MTRPEPEALGIGSDHEGFNVLLVTPPGIENGGGSTKPRVVAGLTDGATRSAIMPDDASRDVTVASLATALERAILEQDTPRAVALLARLRAAACGQ